MKNVFPILIILAASTLFITGCATAPRTDAGKERLADNIAVTMKTLKDKDPGLRDFLDRADAYAIFPSVGKGGIGIGGSYGRGEVYEHGKRVGYADISKATIGAQLGGQEFTEIIAFETPQAFDQFRSGKLQFDATASAVALKSGVARTARYSHGVAIFIDIKSGAMFEAVVGGQSFSYQPL